MSTGIVTRFKEASQSAMAAHRPWAEFVDLSALSLPLNLSEATPRLFQNLTHFRSNYAMVFLVVLFLSLVYHPISIIVFLIDLYSERCMVKPAEELFDSLKSKGDANEFTFAMMLCMYKRMGRFQEAIQIAKQMRELRLLTDLLSYNNVIGLYATYGRFKEVVGTFKEMTKAAIQPDECTFKSLGLVLVKSGLSKQAVGKLEVSVKMDARSGLQAWMSALSSVVRVNEIPSL